MKNAICKGGCKKGDCNGDCKRSAVSKNHKQRVTLVTQNPELKKIGSYLQFDQLASAAKNERKARQLSKKEFGRLAGVKKSQVSKIENNFAAAKLDSIIKVFALIHH